MKHLQGLNIIKFIVDNWGWIITAFTPIFTWFTVDRYKARKNRSIAKIEENEVMKEQLNKLYLELSDIFEEQLVKQKELHHAKLKLVKVNALIEQIRIECHSDCIEKLLESIEKSKL